MGAGTCSVATRGEAGKGCWGRSPGIWGSSEGAGGQLSRRLARLAARVPRSLSPRQRGRRGCRRQGAGLRSSLARRICHAGSGGLAACLVPLRRRSVVGATLVTSTRHPNDSRPGGQAGNAFCFPLGLLPVPTGSRGIAPTSSRSSYWSMMLFSFSASSVFSWQSFMFLSLCCSIWAWISLSVPWKWLVISFLFSSSSRARWIVSSCC